MPHINAKDTIIALIIVFSQISIKGHFLIYIAYMVEPHSSVYNYVQTLVTGYYILCLSIDPVMVRVYN